MQSALHIQTLSVALAATAEDDPTGLSNGARRARRQMESSAQLVARHRRALVEQLPVGRLNHVTHAPASETKLRRSMAEHRLHLRDRAMLSPSLGATASEEEPSGSVWHLAFHQSIVARKESDGALEDLAITGVARVGRDDATAVVCAATRSNASRALPVSREASAATTPVA